MVELPVFLLSAVAVLAGGLGVVLSRNAVHSALLLVMTLFGIAVLFVQQEAHFLAAVQVIVYAGAIVVLFLFVIMLLGVDRAERLDLEPLVGQRPAAVVVGAATFGLVVLAGAGTWATGAPTRTMPAVGGLENVAQVGRVLFSDYLFAFEATSVLLVIAVVAAVVMARRPLRPEDLVDSGEELPGTAAPAADEAPADAGASEQVGSGPAGRQEG